MNVIEARDINESGADPGVGKGRGTNRLGGWKNRACYK